MTTGTNVFERAIPIKPLVCLVIAACFVLLAAAPLALAQEAKDPTQEKFLEGMKKMEQGEYFEAKALFHGILSNQPQLHRARLELAVAYYRLYEYEEAKRQAKIVLDDPDTPPNVRVTILAFLAQIDKEEGDFKKKHHWEPYAEAGWLYDTNVNVGPGSDVIDINGQIRNLSPGSTARSDSAVVLSAGLAHRYTPGYTPQIGNRKTVFMWQSNASYYRRDYTDEHAFDLDVASIATGPALIALGQWRANLNMQADYIALGSDDLAYFFSAMPSFTYEFLKGNLEVTLDGTLSRRDFRQDIDQGRDGLYSALQLSAGNVFLDGKLVVQLGGKVFGDDTDDIQYSHDGYGWFAGLSIAPLSDISVYARANETHFNYDGPADGTGTPGITREEREMHCTVGADYALRYKWLDGFVIRGMYEYTDNNSTVAFYEYIRKQLTFTLSRRF